MITLTTSQTAATLASQAEPRVLVEIDTENGTYGFAQEHLTWSGVDYRGRLLNPGQLQASIQGADTGTVPSQTLTVEIANADGWATRKRPSFWRNKPARIKEVFLDVQSDAIRTTGMLVTGMDADLNSCRLTLEEQFSAARRAIIPINDEVITTQIYANADAGSPALGNPIPILYGHTYAPMLLVDQRSSIGDRYVFCQGSATTPGFVVEYFDTSFSPISSPIPTSGTPIGQPFSLQVFVRNGITVSEILVEDGIPQLNGVPRFVEAISPLGEFVTPAQVFADLMTRAGVGNLVDSDANLTAHSWYLATSHFLDCTLSEQRPLEDWLSDLAHDGLFRIHQHAKVAITPIKISSTGIDFNPANILSGTMAITDIPTGQEFSHRTIFFYNRTTDPRIGQQQPPSFAEWEVGSVAELSRNSFFIGRKSVAQRVAQTYAKQDAAGIRTYNLGSTVRLTSLEEGDAVTLTHSAVNATALRCEITAVNRQNGVYTFTLREQPDAVYNIETGLSDSADFGVTFQRVIYNAGSFDAEVGSNVQLVTGSHQLAKTPTSLTAVVNPNRTSAVVSSLIAGATTNNSQFVVRNVLNLMGRNMQDWLFAWDLRV